MAKASIAKKHPEQSLADRDARCRLASEAAMQITGLSSSLRVLTGEIDVLDSDSHGAAVLAMAMRCERLSTAIYCLLEDPADSTDDIREIVHCSDAGVRA